MTDPSSSVPVFSLCEIESLIGALAALQPVVVAAMPGWPERYREAVTKALDVASVSGIPEVGLTAVNVGTFRVDAKTACNCEGQ
ncbi:hypothetical protein EV138_3019 [Kribbella voronezhensis]|uniref:Uncharacterized protein n=1 Tax=Kribbella voronezhensis TaxID=2512212 RepID=A0A4R7TBM6_9ACTN|nr:hypothetical protein [Kribbella voronezhensis]TDU89451.1 hypothetical protein EV138_3019 [Kribbella voronezhensis]